MVPSRALCNSILAQFMIQCGLVLPGGPEPPESARTIATVELTLSAEAHELLELKRARVQGQLALIGTDYESAEYALVTSSVSMACHLAAALHVLEEAASRLGCHGHGGGFAPSASHSPLAYSSWTPIIKQIQTCKFGRMPQTPNSDCIF
jgi:hypothetical protein